VKELYHEYPAGDIAHKQQPFLVEFNGSSPSLLEDMSRPIGYSIGIAVLFQLAVFLFTPAHAAQIIDGIGRTVTVPATPCRVLALAPNLTEIVFELDRGDLLVGATQFSNHPAAAAQLPRVGSYIRPDIEKIVALKPDLCLASKDGNPRHVVERIEQLGISVFVVDPRNLEQIMTTVEQIGSLLGAKEAARTITADIRQRRARITEGLRKSSKRPTVFFQIDEAPMVSVGTDTFIHELITLAGGRNIAQGPVPYPRYNWEDILRMQPEVVIITSMAGGRSAAELLASWRQWQQLPAVQHDRVYVVDANLFDRPTPRLIDGLEVLASLIHPELFPARRGEQSGR
jgi:iron complex transport system substrate-binding protein